MFISEKLVRRFQQLYSQKFQEEISAEQAEQDLIGLAELVRITIKKEVKDE